jgi:hypothetical protein
MQGFSTETLHVPNGTAQTIHAVRVARYNNSLQNNNNFPMPPNSWLLTGSRMPNDLKNLLLHPEQNWLESIHVFNTEILPKVLHQLNQSISLHQIAKLEEERLPENERNLTDARTRIGVLLEYSLAICLDSFLAPILGPGYLISFVVANKFPDLTLRDPDHRPLLRVEVKCIQTAAEEKSANLDALIRDIHPRHDLLCVLIWEWQQACRGQSAIEYPHVHRGYVFDAYTISKVRDWGWLNEPKAGKTNDIDITSAVVCQDNRWKKEEKNLGKLMRIADRRALGRPPLEHLAGAVSVADYLTFKAYVTDLALRELLSRILRKAGQTTAAWNPQPIRFDEPSRLCATRDTQGSQVVIYFASSRRWTQSLRQSIANDLQSQGINRCRVLVMAEKFAWLLSEYEDGTWSKPFGNKKPGPLIDALRP